MKWKTMNFLTVSIQNTVWSWNYNSWDVSRCQNNNNNNVTIAQSCTSTTMFSCPSVNIMLSFHVRHSIKVLVCLLTWDVNSSGSVTRLLATTWPLQGQTTGSMSFGAIQFWCEARSKEHSFASPWIVCPPNSHVCSLHGTWGTDYQYLGISKRTLCSA